jgi:Cof subfamily protein (haloacid dehalogenase superfamily)
MKAVARPLPEFRLLVTDFDGTILNWKEHRITPHTVAAIRAFCRNDGRYVCATARPYYALSSYLRPLGRLSSLTILCNGSWVRDRGEDILFSALDSSVVRRLTERWWDHPGLRLMFIGRSSTLINRWSPHKHIRNYQTTLRSRVVPVSGIKGPVLNVEADGPADLLKELSRDLTACCRRKVVCRLSWPEFMEIYAGGVSKGKALDRVRRRIGCARSEIIAFGDGNNDLDLLAAAGTGVAMANATPEMKSAAGYVTDACNDDGVARFLEEKVLSNAFYNRGGKR